MIMIFDTIIGSEAVVEGDPPRTYPSWSAYEISAALERKQRPTVLIFRNHNLSVVPAPDDDDDDNDNDDAWQVFRKKRREQKIHKKTLDAFLLGLPKEDCKIVDLDLLGQFDGSVPSLVVEIIEGIAAERHNSGEPERPRSPPRDPNPYQGLDGNNIEHGDCFFGRESEIAAILTRLQDPEVRFQVIHGPSGTGKSSLLAAGLLYRLIRNAEGMHYSYSLFKPSQLQANPFMALMYSLTVPSSTAGHLPFAGDKDAIAGALLAASRKGIDEAGRALERSLLSRLPRDPHHRLIMAINQFEELWTTATSSLEPFLNLLAAAEASGHVLVLGAIRNDLESPCLARLKSCQSCRSGGRFYIHFRHQNPSRFPI